MRKVLLVILFLLAAAIEAQGQSTTVSGQVTDAGGQSWNNGTFTFTFVLNPNYPTFPQYTWTGGTLNNTISGVLNATGGYSVSIPSNSAISPINSQWSLKVCAQASAPCFTTSNTTVTGGTQTLNATPPAILINLSSAAPPVSAYSTTEVTGAVLGSQFFLIGTGLQVCSAVSGNTCTTWTSAGASIVVPSLPNGNGVYVSPTCPASTANCFAVFADAQFVSDAVYTATSPTVTTPGGDPPFACPGSVYPCSTPGPGSDAGKIVFGSFNCGDATDGPCVRNLPQGTITTVNSAHSITASTNAINTSGSGSLGATDCPLLWGHDDGAQLAAATAAMIVNARNGPSSNLTLPCGNMMTGVPPFIVATAGSKLAAYGISGCGGGGTLIIPLPKMNCSTGANTGCLISDVEHVEGGGEVEPGGHFRDITFYGGGTDVKDPAASITVNTSGIRITFWDELENVWIIGWLWNAPTNTPRGITNAGGMMLNSGTYAAGNPGCALQGNVNTVATMKGGSCGASGGDGAVILPNTSGATGASSQVETSGVYFNLTSIGSAVSIHNNGGMWSDHGSHVADEFLSDNVNSISYLNGTELNQSGGGASTLTVSNGLVHLNLVNIQASGGPINQTGGSIFDDCGNSLSDAVNPIITALYGSCSITGIADVAGNHVLTSGWGTANVNTVTGSVNDVRFTISVTAGVPAASPVLTDTFAVPYWATPSGGCTLIQEGGTFGILTNPVPSALTRTGITWTFAGTPVATQSYTFVRHCANS